MKSRALLLFVTLATAALCISEAKAAFIPLPPNPPPPTFAPNDFTSGSPLNISYNAASEVFTALGIFPKGFIDPLTSPSTPPLIDDIFGAFSLTATIDHAGNVLGGSYFLIGGSAELGLSGISNTLISGDILDGGLTNIGSIDFLVTISSINAAFEAALGVAVDEAIINIGGGADFTTNFARMTPTTAPDIFFLKAVDEPDSAFVFFSALVGFVLCAVRTRQMTGRRE